VAVRNKEGEAVGTRVRVGKVLDLGMTRTLGNFLGKQGEGHGRTEHAVTAEPEVVARRREPGRDEFVVLACDGVWDVMSNEECVGFVRAELAAEGGGGGGYGVDVDAVAQRLVLRCLEKGSTDNISAVIVLLTPERIDRSLRFDSLPDAATSGPEDFASFV